MARSKKITLSEDFQKWRRSERQDADAQLTYDNAADGFLQQFPTRDVVNQDNTVLDSHLWWWRSLVPDSAHQIFQMDGVPDWPQIMLGLFQDRFQRCAYLYEFRARYDDRYRWDF